MAVDGTRKRRAATKATAALLVLTYVLNISHADDQMFFLSLDNEGSCCTSQSSHPPSPDRTVVTLGYLAGTSGRQQGRKISGAIGYAVEQINNCSCLLPDVRLEIDWHNTLKLPTGEYQVHPTKAVVDMICNKTAAFIGPEGPDCDTEAMVAGSQNLALLSYKCADDKINR